MDIAEQRYQDTAGHHEHHTMPGAAHSIRLSTVNWVMASSGSFIREHLPVLGRSPLQELQGIIKEPYTPKETLSPAPRKHVTQKERQKKVFKVGCCNILRLLIGREQAKRCHQSTALLQPSHGFLQQHTFQYTMILIVGCTLSQDSHKSGSRRLMSV